jgi:(p)ppGpp synthase/HD superfamily hydrolase
MHCFAQTNIQLFNQLSCDGYSIDDIRCIFNTYSLSMQLFTGRFRPSGKTFIAHLIGTASILSFLHAPAKVVAAGLIHAAYEYGDFGDGKRGSSIWKRKQLKQTLGQEIENYVATYFAFVWNEQTIPTIYDRLSNLDQIEQDVLLIRLANELEEHLDFGLLYCGVSKQKQYSNHAKNLILSMAEKLGKSALATELEKVFREIDSAKSIEFCSSSNWSSSMLIAPKSYRKRVSVALYCFLKATRHSMANATTDLLNYVQNATRIRNKLQTKS